MPKNQTSVFLADPQATDRFGASLSALLQPGDIVLLKGDLGAGKTALARAIIRTLVKNPSLDVPSPSFALVQPYIAGTQAIVHADLYRLAEVHDVEELGLFDDPEAIILIEWPERVPTLGEMAAYNVCLELPTDGEGRKISISSSRDQTNLATWARDEGFVL